MCGLFCFYYVVCLTLIILTSSKSSVLQTLKAEVLRVWPVMRCSVSQARLYSSPSSCVPGKNLATTEFVVLIYFYDFGCQWIESDESLEFKIQTDLSTMKVPRPVLFRTLRLPARLLTRMLWVEIRYKYLLYPLTGLDIIQFYLVTRILAPETLTPLISLQIFLFSYQIYLGKNNSPLSSKWTIGYSQIKSHISKGLIGWPIRSYHCNIRQQAIYCYTGE